MFRVPEGYKGGFRFFIELSDKQRDKFIQEVKESGDTLSLDDLTIAIVTQLEIKKEKIDEINNTLLSLFILKDSTNLDLDTLVSEILNALEGTNEEALKPPESLRNQLIELLKLERSPYFFKSKAKTLKKEREKLLIDTRIITDIRPIFTEDDYCRVMGNLIIHNLKIVYGEGGNIQEIFLAVDKDDLKRLKKNIERADKKEEVLRNELKKSSIPIIDNEG